MLFDTYVQHTLILQGMTTKTVILPRAQALGRIAYIILHCIIYLIKLMFFYTYVQNNLILKGKQRASPGSVVRYLHYRCNIDVL